MFQLNKIGVSSILIIHLFKYPSFHKEGVYFYVLVIPSKIIYIYESACILLNVYFTMQYSLGQTFCSERFRGDVFAARCPACDHLSVSAHSKSFSSRSQFENALKLIF